MKKMTLIAIGLILGGCSTYNPNFNVVLGSGFTKNSIDLRLNEIEIINKKVVSSDLITGFVTNTFVVNKNDSLSVLGNSNEIEKKILFPPSRILNFIIQIDGKPYYLQADLKKGSNILINKHSYYYNVELKQFKKNLKFY